MFGDRRDDAGNVGLLEGVLTNIPQVYLAGDGQERDRIQVRVGDAGHQIGGAGAGGGDADAGLTRGPGIAAGAVRRALLVPHQDMLKVVASQILIKIEDLAAGVAKYHVHPFFHEKFDDVLRAVFHFIRLRSFQNSIASGCPMGLAENASQYYITG